MTHPSDALPMPEPHAAMEFMHDANVYSYDQLTAARREAWDAAAALAMRLDQEHGFTAQPSAQALKDAGHDVLAERRRQVEAEGWMLEHDDKHLTRFGEPELPIAAACYAMAGIANNTQLLATWWPWDVKWWKPSSPRRNLVKAGALILAEIERLDRAAIAATAKEPT